jgi:hypothetical protein
VIVTGLGIWDGGEKRTIEVYTTDARVFYVLLFELTVLMIKFS